MDQADDSLGKTLETLLLERNDPRAAIHLLQDHLQEHGDDAAAWNNLGILLMHEQRMTEALSAFKKAHQLAPHDETLTANLLKVLVHQKNEMDEAFEIARRHLQDHPSSTKVRYVLGLMLAQLDRNEEARQELSVVVDHDPTNFEAWVNLGLLYNADQQFTKGKECLEKAMNLNSEDSDVHFLMAVTCLNLGFHEEALRHCQQSLQLEPHNHQQARNLKKIIKMALEEKETEESTN